MIWFDPVTEATATSTPAAQKISPARMPVQLTPAPVTVALSLAIEIVPVLYAADQGHDAHPNILVESGVIEAEPEAEGEDDGVIAD